MKTFMRRTLTGLVPDDERSLDALKGIKPGSVVAVEVSRPRNLHHHRLFWALASKIADAIDATPENVVDVLKLRTGHFTTVNTKSGPVQLPRSISFSKMSQDEFREFFERCCRVVTMEWLPDLKAKEVQTEILTMLGITWSEAA